MKSALYTTGSAFADDGICSTRSPRISNSELTSASRVADRVADRVREELRDVRGEHARARLVVERRLDRERDADERRADDGLVGRRQRLVRPRHEELPAEVALVERQHGLVHGAAQLARRARARAARPCAARPAARTRAGAAARSRAVPAARTQHSGEQAGRRQHRHDAATLMTSAHRPRCCCVGGGSVLSRRLYRRTRAADS